MPGGEIPHGSIPKNTSLPSDMYRLRIEELEDTTSGSGKRMFSLATRVVNGDFDGAPYWENYVVGTDGDPEAKQDKTWKRLPAVNFRRLLEAANVPKLANPDQQCQAAIGMEFEVFLDEYEETKEGPWKGDMRNRIRRYYKVGEAPQGNGAVAQAPVAAPSAAPGNAQQSPPKPATGGGMVQCGSCGSVVIRTLLAKHQAEECVALQNQAGMAAQSAKQ